LAKDEDDEGDTCRQSCTFIGHRVCNPPLDNFDDDDDDEDDKSSLFSYAGMAYDECIYVLQFFNPAFSLPSPLGCVLQTIVPVLY